MKLLSTIFFAVLLFTQSCKDNCINDPVSQQIQLDGVIPMKVGYSWNYFFSSYDSTGHQNTAHNIQTMEISRDTLINKELWFIFNDSAIRTNRIDGMWFLSNGEPRLGYTITLNDSACTAPEPYPCDYYIKLVAVDSSVNILGVTYSANIYDWIFPDHRNKLGYRIYNVFNLGQIRIESYSETLSGFAFLAYTQDLVYARIE